MCMHDKHACEFIYEMDHERVCVMDHERVYVCVCA